MGVDKANKKAEYIQLPKKYTRAAGIESSGCNQESLKTKMDIWTCSLEKGKISS